MSTVARVVALDGADAIVAFDGVQRRASALMVPNLAVDDLVLIGLGTVLGRIDEDDAAALLALQAELIDHGSDPRPADRP